jgi:hypothetical protein
VKKTSLVLGLLTALVITSVVAAQGVTPPGGGWWSGEQVQNVSEEEATVVVTAYDSASTATYAADATLAAGASTTFLPASFDDPSEMPDGFQGSAIVTADQPIKAIVNVTNRQAGDYGISGGLAAGQYQGVDAGATTINFPLAKNNHYSKYTTFYIQNAGSAAATATATFVMGGTSYPYTTPSIGPGQMVVVTPGDASAPSGNNVGLGSLTVTSSQPLAGVVLEHGTEDPATIVQATRGFVPDDAGVEAYAPIIKNAYYNRFTGLQVQNVSGAAVDVTVTYAATCINSANSGTYTETTTGLADGASYTFVHLTSTGSNLPEGCLASATVGATGDVVAIVNESYLPAFLTANPSRSQESVTYSANSAATAKVSAPLFKEDSYNKGTGLQVQNVGTVAATNVVLVFSGAAGTFTSVAQEIGPGGSLTFVDVRNKAASFWDGTAMTPTALGCTASGCAANGVFGVTVTSDQPIVAIANESTYPFTAPRISQDKNNYEGFNLTP